MTIARDLSKILDANGDLNIDANTLFVDSSTNRVGIGTSSPDNKLHIQNGDASASSNSFSNLTVEGNSSYNILQFLSPNTASQQIRFGDPQDNGAGYIQFNHSDNSMSFGSPSERLRIDSSGNVLVGTTSASGSSAPDNSSSTGDVGVRISNSSGFVGVGSDTVALFANRIGSDGEVIRINKDGTQVGSIASVDGNSIMIGDGNANLRFYSGTNVVIPADSSGSNQSNVVSLGNASSTFKDFYLAGNIYLGGTGSANALDDYEEGTWTPAFEPTTGSFTSITYDTQAGYYTKVGNLVTATFRIKTDAITVGTASGALKITGLPFSKSSVSNDRGVGAVWRSNWANTDAPEFVVNSSSGTSHVLPFIHLGATIRSTEVADMGTGANDNEMYCSITYRTD